MKEREGGEEKLLPLGKKRWKEKETRIDHNTEKNVRWATR